jgi:hypothetical protein
MTVRSCSGNLDATGVGVEAENANIFSTNAGRFFKKVADYLIRRFDAPSPAGEGTKGEGWLGLRFTRSPDQPYRRFA